MHDPRLSTFRRLMAPGLGLVALLLPGLARAAEEPGWSLNFTPVLLPKDDYRVGGGTDPELKYSRDLGGAHSILIGARATRTMDSWVTRPRSRRNEHARADKS